MLYSENIRFNSGRLVFSDKTGQRLSFEEARKKMVNRVYNWWLDFKLWLVDSAGLSPFWFWRRFFYHWAGLKIGRGSKIHVFARFFEPKNIVIGQGSIVGEGVFLDGRDKLTIGDHVDIASEVMIYNSEHQIADPEFKAITAPVEIGDYVFIGPRAIILPGIKIGKGAVVAAGAVVTKDVLAGEVVGGVPARKIKERKVDNLHYRLGRTRLFQ